MLAGLYSSIQGLGPVHFWILAALAAAGLVSGWGAAFSCLRRARMLEDVPTSRIRSASQGYVELQGTGRMLDGPPIIAPLTQTRCTWWSYRIEERVDDRRQRWKTVAEASSDELFALEDETGRCIIDPEHAEVFPMITRRWRGDSSKPTGAVPPRRRFASGAFRYTEQRMHSGDPLYAIGHFQTRYMTDEWDVEHEVGDLLRQWKRDQTDLLGRFDRNRDGRLDLDEWDAARAAARRQVMRERSELDAHPGLSFLSAPTDGRPYLLGALPQLHLARRLRRKALAGLAVLIGSGLALAVLLTARFG